MCTARDTCDFQCDAFPSRDASQKRIFGFTKMNEKKVDFFVHLIAGVWFFVRNTMREEVSSELQSKALLLCAMD